MDRSLLEGNPHAVIEGMIIGAYAIGSNDGLVYVRNEYPLAVKNLRIAIAAAREYGLLGKNILGSGFDFDIEISRGGTNRPISTMSKPGPTFPSSLKKERTGMLQLEQPAPRAPKCSP
jgi:hypothetical protein